MKYSVLTYLFGDYGKLHELPFENTNPNVEYVCVTDKKELKSNTWTIIYDETLNCEYLNGFDKTFVTRYNPFKYCKSDICVRIDSSITPMFNLDDLVDKFIDGNYDIAINLHPDNVNIISELYNWKLHRGIDQVELQTSYIENTLKYDVMYNGGLYQVGLQILRNNPTVNKLNKDMIETLYDCTPKRNHVNRLDQTLFTALFNKKYADKLKIMPLSWNLFCYGGMFRYTFHNTDKIINFPSTKFKHVLNGENVNAYGQ